MDRADGIEAVTLETASGRLGGYRRDGTVRFKGIPFARPPIGPLRWRMPEPAVPWAGVRDATQFSAVAPQAPTQLETLMGGSIGEQSEDCLYLNVWTPACDDAKRPVMVWIHGGAFAIGAGSLGIYNGRRFAQRDIVVVTVNYRLGAFGFLNLADASEGRAPGTGAEGLGDQLLALDWVKRNIAGFGGDPGNVTIFGESAGGMSIGALLASPLARGLFHKAIPQSGAAHIGYDRERSARVAHAVLEELKLAPAEAARVVDAPYGAVIKAQIAILAGMRGGKDSRKLGRLPFQPTIDGAILPVRAIEAVRSGSARDIPLLAGTTREEWKLFTGADPRMRFLTMGGLAERIGGIAGDAAPAVLAAYPEGSPFERFNAVMTDRVFTIPCARLLEAQSRYAPVHQYRFDWRSPFLGGIMGACHAIELGFVFGTFADGKAANFFGKGAGAFELSQTMMECWAAFARTGNPATSTTGAWPQYDSAARDTMIFGDGAPHLLHAPDEARLHVWDAVPERKLGL
jgi:para-nitrobenzyl esterase